MLNENILQKIFETVSNEPGIDTPEVCLEVFKDNIKDPKHRGVFLARWLMKEHKSDWEKVCNHVDKLIETGHIAFTDTGRLYPADYQGEIK
tara:strand:- start:10 stop:282 length:273 start_codon:yes stop_codon:yes gene_type:complete